MACGPTAGTDGTATGATSSTTTDEGSGSTSTSSTSGPSDGDTTSGSTTTGLDSTTTGPDVACESPWPNATVIACPGSGNGTLAASGSTVFFETGSSIFSVDASAGGEPELLVEGAGSVVQVLPSGPYLYWVSRSTGEVGRVELETGAVETVAGLGNPSRITTDGELLYVSEYAAAGSVSVVDLAAGTATPLYVDLDSPGDLVLDAGTLFISTSTNNGNNDTPIMQGTPAGDPLSTLYSDNGLFTEMLLDGGALFMARYRVGSSTIERTPIGDPASTEVLAIFDRQPLWIALTTDRVYWIEAFVDASNHGYLRSVARAGGAISDHLEADDILGDVVATADDVVVFRSPDGVVRLDE